MQLSPSIVVCLDLALANTGIAVLRINPGGVDELLHVHTIHTEKAKSSRIKVSADEWRRTTELTVGIADAVRLHQPAHIFIECPTGGSKSASAARSMAVARGAACACLQGLNIKATLVTPFEAKAAATGNKLATKHEVRDAVKLVFPDFTGWIKGKRGQELAGLNEHVYDALSVYMAARFTPSYKELKVMTQTQQTPQRSPCSTKAQHLPDSLTLTGAAICWR